MGLGSFLKRAGRTAARSSAAFVTGGASEAALRSKGGGKEDDKFATEAAKGGAAGFAAGGPAGAIAGAAGAGYMESNREDAAGAGGGRAALDTSALDQRARSSDEEYRRMLEQANGYNFNTPTAAAAQGTQAGNVLMRDPGAARTYTAATTAAPTDVGVRLLDQGQGVQAQQVAAQPGASAAGAVAAQVDDSAGQEIRGRQLGYLDQLQAAAAGRGPSAAESQFQNGLADVSALQNGMVAQARGNDRAAARREAILGAGRQGAQNALSAAQLKANEQIAARGALGGALSDVRGTDTGVAIQNANLKQGASLQNAAVESDVSKYDAGLASANANANADRTLAADTFTAGQQNARDLAGATLRAQVGAGNADRTLGANQFNAGATNAAGQFGASASNNMEQYRSGLAANVDTGNVDRIQHVNDINTANQQQVNISNQNAGLTAEQIRNGARQDLRQDAIAMSGQGLGADVASANTRVNVATTNANIQSNENKASNDRFDKYLGAAANGLSAYGASKTVNQAQAPAATPGSTRATSAATAGPDDVLPLTQAQTQAPAPVPAPAPAPAPLTIDRSRTTSYGQAPAPQAAATAAAPTRPTPVQQAGQSVASGPGQPMTGYQQGLASANGAPAAQGEDEYQRQLRMAA